MNYVNHDFISLSLKDFMGYVNHEINSMMNFKTLKIIREIKLKDLKHFYNF